MFQIKNKSKYFPIVFSSFMLVFSLIGSFFSNLLPFLVGASFLRVDLGITFIIMCFLVSGWKYGLLILISNFLIHPFLPGANIGLINLFFIGKTIFVITCLIFYFNIFWYHKFFKKNLLINFLVSIIITTILMVALNGLIFTPIFLNIISNGSFSVNFLELMEQYTNNSFLKLIFIFPNYWWGITFIYGFFNIFSLGINSFFIITLIKKFHNEHFL